MNVIFAGTPDFAARALRALIQSRHTVSAVLTQPDRPAGRGQRLQPSTVKQDALDHHIPVLQPARLRGNDEALTQLRSYAADVMVVVAYGLILPPAVLAVPRHGCINIHASLLPRWRGAAPIQRAILAGDHESGVTIIQMEEGLDTGPMLSRVAIPLAADETGHSLHDKLAVLGAELIVDVLDRLEGGGVTAVPQDHARACYASKIEKDEAWLSWADSATEIERKVRAFNAWPVARTRWGSTALQVWRAMALADSATASPGTVLRAGKDGIDVAAAAGSIRLLEVQVPGKRPMAVADFLNSRPLKPGDRFDSGPPAGSPN